MATYAIGDIQGCFDELQVLLEKIGFDPASDHLWFAGDLVNRGPKSLETLRFIRQLGSAAITVLGNHDLHLIAAANRSLLDEKDRSLQPVIDAPDGPALIDWLRWQPLLHHDADLGYTMVHAGIPPQWNLVQASECAREVESVLRSDQLPEFLSHMYGNTPRKWSDTLSGWDRLRYITNSFTRMRYCDDQGRLEFKSKGPPGSQPPPYRPWFEIPWRKSADLNIVFGHWSTLGPRDEHGIFPLDSACLWGGQLTALRLDTRPEHIRVPCPRTLAPGN